MLSGLLAFPGSGRSPLCLPASGLLFLSPGIGIFVTAQASQNTLNAVSLGVAAGIPPGRVTPCCRPGSRLLLGAGRGGAVPGTGTLGSAGECCPPGAAEMPAGLYLPAGVYPGQVAGPYFSELYCAGTGQLFCPLPLGGPDSPAGDGAAGQDPGSSDLYPYWFLLDRGYFSFWSVPPRYRRSARWNRSGPFHGASGTFPPGGCRLPAVR